MPVYGGTEGPCKVICLSLSKANYIESGIMTQLTPVMELWLGRGRGRAEGGDGVYTCLDAVVASSVATSFPQPPVSAVD